MTHCTNGVVIQRIPLTCAPPPDVQVEEAHPEKRTVTHIATDVIPYHSGRRQGPAVVRININQVIQGIPETTQRARLIDFVWILCRQLLEDSLFALSVGHPQVIPAWTAFNIRELKQQTFAIHGGQPELKLHKSFIFPMVLSPILRLFLKSRDLKEFITSPKIHSTEVLTLLIFLLYNSIAGVNALAPALTHDLMVPLC